MLRYLLRRLFYSLVTLFVISLLVFVSARLTGDPIELLFPDAGYTPAQQAALRREYGLDRPQLLQYWIFVTKAIQGDFGRSIRSTRPAMEEVLSRAPATIELALWAMGLTLLLGVPLGVAAGAKPDSIFDRGVKGLAILGHAAPAYWIALIAIWLFAGTLRILPASGRGGLEHIIMPAFVQAWFSMAGIVRISRSSMLEALTGDFVRMARIKGVPEHRVISIHALKNASLPIVTLAGLDLAAKLGGVAITEIIFAWPGIGRLAVTATYQRDYPVVQAAVLFAAVLFIVINFVVDIVYTLLDPRVRLE